MSRLSKVVWSEGMHLAPHHFQAQSAYFEEALQFALTQLFFAPYGLVACELDHDALRTGSVALLRARGVMPDGLAFDIPHADDAPPRLAVGDALPPTQESRRVLLTIPALARDRAERSDAHLGNGRLTRFAPATVEMADESTGRDPRPVTVGRKNLRLAFEGDAAHGVVSLPVAQLRRDASGRVVYDPDYVPPCLQIGASERLVELLRDLVAYLDEKAGAIAAEQRPDPGASGARVGAGDLVALWLLYAIRSSLPPLRNHLQLRRTRPDELYTELARLAGALCTFVLGSHPSSLPLYEHDRLGECFLELDRHIRAHIDLARPTNVVAMPLMRSESNLHTATVTDPRCLGRSHWVLGVRAAAGAAEVITRVPRDVKICSGRFALELVRRGHSGLAVEHLPLPPAEISPRADWQYFTIVRAGPCWSDVTKTSTIGVFVPDRLPDAELALFVVLDR
jgi:type VI secretion system protein ImpJ